ncbi:WD repeat-containing protein 60 isoform X2 [Cynoglossus semilaevis]|uniref:WD repeat-containing protein 60 isoform X2 n=1 Tax=Cynoglossus semilaevis TaxID=244447 RepID=UPI000D62CBFC|nr:WD repeat-containing protein 60 isoform X2 [Cynoglossus semilaevis]
MNRDKEKSMEDTWKTAELRRHIRDETPVEEYVRKREDSQRKHRGGDRRHRDTEKESRRERDKHGDTREKRHDEERDRHADESQDRRSYKDRDRKEERDKDRERRKERDRQKHDMRKSRDKDGVKDREGHDGGERDKRMEKEIEEREKRRERRRHEEGGSGREGRVEKHDREKRQRHQEREQQRDEREKRKKKDQERHGGQEVERSKDRAGHRRHTVDREDAGQRQKYDSDSRQKTLDEEERQRHGDREERRHRDKEGVRDRRRPQEERHERMDATNEKRHERMDATNEKRHERMDATNEAAGKSKERETNRVKAEAGDEEDHDQEYEYEDDFEDYEEDFEDFNPSEDESESEFEATTEEVTAEKKKEIESIQRAMKEENQRVGVAQSPRGGDQGHPCSKAPQPGRFIDFVAAKQREVNKKVSTRQKKRSAELLRLMELDFSLTTSLLDLPPVNEYDRYIRTFGNTNTTQVYVQCHEDRPDRDVQTEEVEVGEKWTQHPAEHCGPCGDPNLCQEDGDKNLKELNFDSQRLAAFLRWASQVVVILLEDDEAERTSLRNLQSQSPKLSFSDGGVQLNTQLPFLCGRPVSLVQFSQVQRHIMMSLHLPTAQPTDAHLDSCTVICVWNIWEPSRPQKVLVYESEVQCCCFSPGKPWLVCAGTSVGSLLLWDLREPAANHHRLRMEDQDWTFRQPTFSTDAVMAGSGHLSTVVSLEVAPTTAVGALGSEVTLLSSEEDSESGGSFQLTSLDQTGLLNFWVVLELPKANDSGSSTDLGLRPGGRVKLLHSSSLHTAERDAVRTGPSQNLHLKFLPSDSNHFFIGTNMGLVRHGTSHGLKASPQVYRFQEAGVRPVEVTSIHFSPFRPDLFLVGCSDGCIRLHAVSQEQPVSQWRSSTAGQAVVSLHWAQTRATLFCVLDSASILYIWDLMRDDTEPVITERLSADRVTAMTVFGDSGPQSTYSGLALVEQSGNIVLQYFSRNWSVSTPAEEEKLQSMMGEVW